jgi:alcohol dehydrogenase
VLDRIEPEGPYAASQPLRLAEVFLAPPGPGELLVKIDAAGICHSDLSVINGDRPRPTPMVLGHEAAATVLAAPHSTEFSPGDKVVISFLPACGQCCECSDGHGYLCGPASTANGQGKLLTGGRRLQDERGEINHHLGVSAFATHAVIDARSAVKVPADVPPEIAALFGCAVLTGAGAVLNTAQLKAGETVMIMGLGGVGLSALLGAVAGGAARIVAIDPSAEKRALALELGATAALAPEDVTGSVRTIIPGGPAVVIETVGNAAVLAQGYAAARVGGRVVTVGLPHPAQQFSISAASLVVEGKTVMGSYMGSSIPRRDVPRYIDMWRAGRLPVDRLLSATGTLSDVNRMMDDLAAGTVVRQVMLI